MTISTEAAREQYGYPPQMNDFFEVFDPSESEENLYCLWINECSQSYLGETAFNELKERFSEAPGIISVEQEDREIFWITTNGVENESLKQRLWEQFLLAAAVRSQS